MLEIKLVSPSALVATEKVLSATVPGLKGYMDIRPNHTSLLSQIATGIVTLKREGFERAYFVSGGFAQVKDNKLIVLADVADSEEDIDLQRAEASEKRALERLTRTSDGTVRVQRALASLKRAQFRQTLMRRG